MDGGGRIGRVGVFRTARPAWAAGTSALSRFWRHRRFRINLRSGNHDQTFRAVTGSDHFTRFAAPEHAFETVELKPAFGPVTAVATDAGCLQHGLNVRSEGHASFRRSGRQFADVHVGGERRAAGENSGDEQCGSIYHASVLGGC